MRLSKLANGMVRTAPSCRFGVNAQAHLHELKARPMVCMTARSVLLKPPRKRTMEANNQTTEANRRRSQRRKPRRQVNVECRKGSMGLGPNICIEFRNLSETGIQVVSKVEMKRKDEVEVLLTGFGMRGTIKRTCEVRWVQPVEPDRFLLGLQFDKAIPFREVHSLTAPDQV